MASLERSTIFWRFRDSWYFHRFAPPTPSTHTCFGSLGVARACDYVQRAKWAVATKTTTHVHEVACCAYFCS